MKKKLIFLSISLALFSSTANADLIIKKDKQKTIQIIDGKEVEVEVETKSQEVKETVVKRNVDVEKPPTQTTKESGLIVMDEKRPDWRKWNGTPGSGTRTLYQAPVSEKPQEQKPQAQPLIDSQKIEVETSHAIAKPEKVEVKVDVKVKQTEQPKINYEPQAITAVHEVVVIDEPETTFEMVTSEGHKPKNVKKAGWGSEVASYEAVMQIVPREFDVDFKNINQDLPVSWSDNKDWDDALASVAKQNNFFAHINWDEKTVVIAGNYTPPAPHQVAKDHTKPSTLSSTVTQEAKEVEVERKIETAVVVPDAISKDVKAGMGATQVIQAPLKEVAPNSWYLDPQLTLKENVTKWGERAGWTVVWEGADYPIVSRAYFTGVFESPDGPLAQIIQAYEVSDQPLVASLTTLDKVVHIRNRIHERAHVVPTTPKTFTPQARD